MTGPYDGAMYSRLHSPHYTEPPECAQTGRFFKLFFIPSNTRSRQKEPLQRLRGTENFPALHEFIGSMGLRDAARTESDGGNAVLGQNPRITKPRRADERALGISRCQSQFLTNGFCGSVRSGGQSLRVSVVMGTCWKVWRSVARISSWISPGIVRRSTSISQ